MKALIILTSAVTVGLSLGLLGCAADNVGSEGNTEAAEAFEGGEGASFVSSPSHPPADVYIESISTGGSGCPNPSDAPAAISTDQRSFLVTFDKMSLSYPPPPLVKNLNCVASVRLHIPAGWQFAVSTVTIKGYAYLTPGIRARHTSRYFFAGSLPPAFPHATLVGPYDGPYSFTDNLGPSVWSGCGGSQIFTIDTTINLNAIGDPGGVGFINTDGVDNVLRKSFQWVWRAC